MADIIIVVGTRPEIIKMAPLVRAFKKHKLPITFVNCGQHHDYNMSHQFVEELALPQPDYTLKTKAYSPLMQMAQTMSQMDRVLKETEPLILLIEGDTNSVLSTAIAANKRGNFVGHVEAGLRSFDLRMPEEHNRRLTDHLSHYLFAPTERAQANLKNENVWGRIYVTGNTVIDAVIQHVAIAERKSKILEKIAFEEFVLATTHRAENVDDFSVLKNFMEAFDEAPLPVVFPIHPRTKKRLLQNKIYKQTREFKNVQILPPLGYFDFLILMKKSKLIVTDSGGVQEEATAPCIRKPVLVIRSSTERPEAVETGFAKVVGTNKKQILAAIEETITNPKKLPSSSPFGDGKASEYMVEILRNELSF